MPSITDWKDDYGGADTNIPQSNTAIPFPANMTTDVGQLLRETKAVIRQESFNKGWEADAYVGGIADPDHLTISAGTLDFTTLYPPGTAVKCVLTASTVYSWVKAISFAVPNNFVTLTDPVLSGPTASVVFAAAKPSSLATPVLGSALRPVLSQWGRFQISGNSTVQVTVPLVRKERDTNYRALIQTVGVAGGTAQDSAYVVTDVTKANTSIQVTVEEAPGTGITMFYEYGLVRGT